ncbi:hypothetical protein BC828DRAFT_412091 [Blastocladiella britannica]|nr:hypothetical protein BC828DRAFT_412091 [Blastocladiella britannica]
MSTTLATLPPSVRRSLLMSDEPPQRKQSTNNGTQQRTLAHARSAPDHLAAADPAHAHAQAPPSAQVGASGTVRVTGNSSRRSHASPVTPTTPALAAPLIPPVFIMCAQLPSSYALVRTSARRAEFCDVAPSSSSSSSTASSLSLPSSANPSPRSGSRATATATTAANARNQSSSRPPHPWSAEWLLLEYRRGAKPVPVTRDAVRQGLPVLLCVRHGDAGLDRDGSPAMDVSSSLPSSSMADLGSSRGPKAGDATKSAADALAPLFLGFKDSGSMFAIQYPTSKTLFTVANPTAKGFALQTDAGHYLTVDAGRRLTTSPQYSPSACTFRFVFIRNPRDPFRETTRAATGVVAATATITTTGGGSGSSPGVTASTNRTRDAHHHPGRIARPIAAAAEGADRKYSGRDSGDDDVPHFYDAVATRPRAAALSDSTAAGKIPPSIRNSNPAAATGSGQYPPAVPNDALSAIAGPEMQRSLRGGPGLSPLPEVASDLHHHPSGATPYADAVHSSRSSRDAGAAPPPIPGPSPASQWQHHGPVAATATSPPPRYAPQHQLLPQQHQHQQRQRLRQHHQGHYNGPAPLAPGIAGGAVGGASARLAYPVAITDAKGRMLIREVMVAGGSDSGSDDNRPPPSAAANGTAAAFGRDDARTRGTKMSLRGRPTSPHSPSSAPITDSAVPSSEITTDSVGGAAAREVLRLEHVSRTRYDDRGLFFDVACVSLPPAVLAAWARGERGEYDDMGHATAAASSSGGAAGGRRAPGVLEDALLSAVPLDLMRDSGKCVVFRCTADGRFLAVRLPRLSDSGPDAAAQRAAAASPGGGSATASDELTESDESDQDDEDVLTADGSIADMPLHPASPYYDGRRPLHGDQRGHQQSPHRHHQRRRQRPNYPPGSLYLARRPTRAAVWVYASLPHSPLSFALQSAVTGAYLSVARPSIVAAAATVAVLPKRAREAVSAVFSAPLSAAFGSTGQTNGGNGNGGGVRRGSRSSEKALLSSPLESASGGNGGSNGAGGGALVVDGYPTLRATGTTIGVHESLTFAVPPSLQQAIAMQSVRSPPKFTMWLTAAITGASLMGATAGIANMLINASKAPAVTTPAGKLTDDTWHGAVQPDVSTSGGTYSVLNGNADAHLPAAMAAPTSSATAGAAHAESSAAFHPIDVGDTVHVAPMGRHDFQVHDAGHFELPPVDPHVQVGADQQQHFYSHDAMSAAPHVAVGLPETGFGPAWQAHVDAALASHMTHGPIWDPAGAMSVVSDGGAGWATTAMGDDHHQFHHWDMSAHVHDHGASATTGFFGV